MSFLLSSRRGSAILVAMIVLILLTITTTVFLEKIWGFSQSSNGIEASNKAYYSAIGLIEQQLMGPTVSKFQPWNIQGTGSLAFSYASGGKLTVFTGDYIVPSIGKGNSPFDSSYNIISLGDPIQLVIPEGINWNNVKFYFRVPQTGSGVGTGVYTVPGNSGAILWTLGYTGASLFASGETNIFKFSDINVVAGRPITAFSGITNSGSTETFPSFYGGTAYLGAGGVNCTGYVCTLKLSLIRPIPTTDTLGSPDGRSLPFLEYKIDFTGAILKSLPNQYMVLQSDAYAYGFMRSRTVRIPQITTNTALDFAVLQ